MVHSSFLLNQILKTVVCVYYRSLQQHVRVQLDLQVNAGFSPRLQVTEMTHQLLTHRVTATTELQRNTIPVTQKPLFFNYHLLKDTRQANLSEISSQSE